MAFRKKVDHEGHSPEKDLGGGAGHEDGGVVGGPFEFQVAAGQMGEDLAVGAAGEDAGDADRQAPVPQARVIPDPRSQVCMRTSEGLEDLHEVDVDAVRERRVALQERAESRDGEGGQVVEEGDRVGVAHRRAGESNRTPSTSTGTLTGGSPGSVVGISARWRIGWPMSTRTRWALPARPRFRG